MTDSDPEVQPVPVHVLPPEPILLSYASAPATRRTWWAGAIIAIYLLVLVAILLSPAWISVDTPNDHEFQLTSAIIVASLVACGLCLVIVPVRTLRRRPITRRSIWIPIIASGLLMGGLVYGGGMALAECLRADKGDLYGWVILAGSILVWIGWSILFAIIAFRSGPQSVGMQLHRWLIAGSVLELLVAVPSHIIVRQRNECCAGILTGMGICIGVGVAFVAFGPSVLLLYHRRWKQITRPG